MIRAAILAAAAGAFTLAPASAQIVPGIKAPETAVDAMSIAQMMGCTFAVLGRPSPFDTSNLEGTVGLTFHEEAPEALLAVAGMDAGDTLAFTIDNPESEVWALNDRRADRCAVLAMDGDLEAASARFIGDFDQGIMEYKAADGSTPEAATYTSDPLSLQATVIHSDGEGSPFAVITERKR